LRQDDEVDAYLGNLKTKLQASLTALYDGFKQLKSEGFKVDAIAPMGAIYLTVKVDCAGKATPDGSVLITSTDVNSYLIKEAGVALVPFSAFGTGEDVNWFRASVGASTLQDVEQIIPRVREALGKLR